MKPIRRVLVVQPYGIGDLLFITPVLRALRLLPGIQYVDLLLGSRNGAVIRGNPHVDEVMEVDKDLFHAQGRFKTFKDALKLGRKLRAKRYDLLLDYSLRGEYGFFGQFFLGIPRRAGYDYKRRGFFHSHKLTLTEGFQGKHTADFCCDLAEAAGVLVRDRWLEFYLNPADKQAASERMKAEGVSSWKNFAAVSPGGGESWGKDAHFKRWPPEFFARFLALARERFFFEGAVIVGGPSEEPLGKLLKESASFPVVNLTGKLTLGQTAAVLERASFFAGNDGGLLHLACARRKPVIGFYGPVDPVVYGPYPPNMPLAETVVKEGLECRPCYQKFRYKSDCPDRRCLQQLAPEEGICFLAGQGFFEKLKTASLE